MSRRHRAEQQIIDPDPLYNSEVLAKFINKLMMSGKKTIARRIVYNAIKEFAQSVKADDPIVAFEQALENVKPTLEVRSRRISGATYQVPVEISAKRRISLAMCWIIAFSRGKVGMSMEKGLTQELIDCYQNKGLSIKKKDDTHRMAEANKAFANFKW